MILSGGGKGGIEYEGIQRDQPSGKETVFSVCRSGYYGSWCDILDSCRAWDIPVSSAPYATSEISGLSVGTTDDYYELFICTDPDCYSAKAIRLVSDPPVSGSNPVWNCD